MCDFYDIHEVRNAAKGRWALIMGALAPQIEPALRKPGRHVGCPIHGGSDGFRLFRKDFADTGGGVCNTCGARSDGFELLKWLHGWTFKESLTHVAGLLGVEPKQSGSERRNTPSKPAQGSRKASAPVTRMTDTRERKAEPASGRALESSSPDWLVEMQERLNKQQVADSQQTKDSIQRIWSECVSYLSDAAAPARRYLANRKITLRNNSVLLEGDCIRVHLSLPYYEEVEREVTENGVSKKVTKYAVKGRFPALVCAIRDADGQIVTLHRTYLTKTGMKARVSEARKMMSVPNGQSVVGGAIRIGDPVDGVLGVAEGLETALSGYRASGVPTWSLVNTTIMQGFNPPEGVHTVIIWADKDKSLAGEQAANVLKCRLEQQGIRVFILMPRLPIPARAKGIDWNDVLCDQGIIGFPNTYQLRSIVYGREVANGRL